MPPCWFGFPTFPPARERDCHLSVYFKRLLLRYTRGRPIARVPATKDEARRRRDHNAAERVRQEAAARAAAAAARAQAAAASAEAKREQDAAAQHERSAAARIYCRAATLS